MTITKLIHCPQNNHQFSISNWLCNMCGTLAIERNGIYTLTTDCYVDRSGFHAEFFEELAEQESKSFWFRARNELIAWAFKKHSPEARTFLEIGCGTGFVIQGLAKRFPHLECFASELLPEGLQFAQKRVPDATFIQVDARKLPFYCQFDAIGAFDVIEHIEEDEQVISSVYDSLVPGGLFLITVPQHPWLWGPNDELACHVRRYTASDLRAKLERAQFKIEECCSFVSLLLPLMVMSRFVQKFNRNGWNSRREMDATTSLPILESVMQLEHLFIRLGLRSCVGGSLLLVARKNK